VLIGFIKGVHSYQPNRQKVHDTQMFGNHWARLLFTLAQFGVTPALVKTREMNEKFLMPIALWLYLSFFFFHVVGRSARELSE